MTHMLGGIIYNKDAEYLILKHGFAVGFLCQASATIFRDLFPRLDAFGRPRFVIPLVTASPEHWMFCVADVAGEPVRVCLLPLVGPMGNHAVNHA